MTKKEFQPIVKDAMRVITKYSCDLKVTISTTSGVFKHDGKNMYYTTIHIHDASTCRIMRTFNLISCEPKVKNLNEVNDLACYLHDYTSK